MNIPFRAVVFDFDGTLIDSAPDLHAAINRVIAKDGRRPLTLEEATPLIWAGSDRMLARAYEITGDAVPDTKIQQAFDEFLDDYGNHCAEKTVFYPGAMENVATLQAAGVATAICTNKRSSLTRRVLNGLNAAHHFDPVTCFDDVGVRKPEPEPLTEVLRLLDVAPGEAVMVGDSAADTGAAKAAGVICIACSFGYSDVPVQQLGADAVIDNHDELLSTLAAF